jgi:hypothetical protein
MATRPPHARAHLVLVPGFAGFDALGQIEYYAGLTAVFDAWRGASGEQRAVLHYFDNLPTASVATRAGRLRSYLAKRIARGELQRGDTLALVGHSTGGLDIRRMIADLTTGGPGAPAGTLPVDGARGLARIVEPDELLELRPRLVFLSVPQRGTNIADWVRARRVERNVAIAYLRTNVAASRLPLADQLQRWAAGQAAEHLKADLLLAVQDSLTEIDADAIPAKAPDRPARVADAEEAESAIALWLRHIAGDFGAIDDLAAEVPKASSSPAHHGDAARSAELQAWARQGIAFRSYATVGPRPFRFDAGPVPVFNPYVPWPRPPQTELEGTDVVYRACYRACAGGPFAVAEPIPPLTLFAGRGSAWPLTAWDNDGIVNTASMLWPAGAETRLVHADHGDIIGHFRLVEAAGDGGRRYHTYDLLGSASGFDQTAFEKVWRDVFEFCVG